MLRTSCNGLVESRSMVSRDLRGRRKPLLRTCSRPMYIALELGNLFLRRIVNQKIIDMTKFNNPRISPMDEFNEIRGSPRRLKIEVTIVTSFVNMGHV